MRGITLLGETGKFTIIGNISSTLFGLREAFQLCLPGGYIFPQGGGTSDGAFFIGTRRRKSLA